MAQVNNREIIGCFPTQENVGKPGFITDFLGIRTRTTYIQGVESQSGVVESAPIPMNFHATEVEWAGSLSSVLQAESSYVAVELGAGWCPWLVAMARAASLRRIDNIQLCGIEACQAHLNFATQHFEDNGFDVSVHRLMHGIVAERDGRADFPVIEDPAADWGSAAILDKDDQKSDLLTSYRGARRLVHSLKQYFKSWRRTKYQRLPAYSMKTILYPYARVDLVHMDIQGHEFDVVHAAREVLEAKVLRLVIGTHSDEISDALRQDLETGPWVLERTEPCTYETGRNKRTLIRDGCQVWRNTDLCAELNPSSLAEIPPSTAA